MTPMTGRCSSAPQTFSWLALNLRSLAASSVTVSGLGGIQLSFLAGLGISRSLGQAAAGSAGLRALPAASEFERNLCKPSILRLNMGRSVGRQALTMAIPSSTIVQMMVEESDPNGLSSVYFLGTCQLGCGDYLQLVSDSDRLWMTTHR